MEDELIIIGYCYYCHDEIYNDEEYRFIPGKGFVHCSKEKLLNCYFEEEEE